MSFAGFRSAAFTGPSYSSIVSGPQPQPALPSITLVSAIPMVPVTYPLISPLPLAPAAMPAPRPSPTNRNANPPQNGSNRTPSVNTNPTQSNSNWKTSPSSASSTAAPKASPSPMSSVPASPSPLLPSQSSPDPISNSDQKLSVNGNGNNSSTLRPQAYLFSPFATRPVDLTKGPSLSEQAESLWRSTITQALNDENGRSMVCANKCGLTVSENADFGFVPVLESSNELQTRTYTINNANPVPALTRIMVMPRREQFFLTDDTGRNIGDSGTELFLVPALGSLRFRVNCCPQSEFGLCRQWILFCFELPIRGNPFDFSVHHGVIARQNMAVNCLPRDMKELSPEAPSFFPRQLKIALDLPPDLAVSGESPPIYSIRSPDELAQTSRLLSACPTKLKKVLQYCLPNGDPNGPTNAASIGVVKASRYRKLGELLTVLLQDPRNLEQKFSFALSETASRDERLRRMRLPALLYTELWQRVSDVRDFDLFDSEFTLIDDASLHPWSIPWKLSHFSRLYSFEAQGVQERRPPVDVGDTLRVRVVGDNFHLDMFAVAHAIRGSTVLVQVPLMGAFFQAPQQIVEALKLKDLNTMPRTFKAHVRFHPQTALLRDMLDVCEQILTHKSATRYLEPNLSHTPVPGPRVERIERADLYDQKCNEEQVAAVSHICSKAMGIVPYIIFGPPGTGKTVTVVEAILQVLRTSGVLGGPKDTKAARANKRAPLSPAAQRTRILVCTPSDYSADIIVSRLSPYLLPSEMLRLNTQFRHTAVDEATVGPFCLRDSANKCFRFPAPTMLLQYHVVVCTCAMAAELSAKQFRDLSIESHFSHAFFDECSQALETELMIPLSLIGPTSAIVLAGDHKQLGPPISCPVAGALGLSVSLQERLVGMPLYRPKPSASGIYYDRRFITKLVRNYRSHPTLLDLTSSLFYDSDLKAFGDRAEVDSLLGWPGLPNGRCPLVFHGIRGQDRYDPESSSFDNPIEVSAIAKTVQTLLSYSYPVTGADGKAGTKSVSTNDIGVIAPYKRQVFAIRKLLRLRGLYAVRVGTVDEYQGKEEKIIIVSTVLSKRRAFMKDINPEDVRAGLFNNVKRLNVALSRGKALVIVFGNPYLLKDVPIWRQVMKFCYRHNAYKGCELPLLESYSEFTLKDQDQDQEQQRDTAPTAAPSAQNGAAPRHPPKPEERDEVIVSGSPTHMDDLKFAEDDEFEFEEFEDDEEEEEDEDLDVEAVFGAGQLGQTLADAYAPDLVLKRIL